MGNWTTTSVAGGTPAVAPLAPNIVPGGTSFSLNYGLYGNFSAATIAAKIAMPTTDPDYIAGHLKKVHILYQQSITGLCTVAGVNISVTGGALWISGIGVGSIINIGGTNFTIATIPDKLTFTTTVAPTAGTGVTWIYTDPTQEELGILLGPSPFASSPVSWSGPFPPIIQGPSDITAGISLLTENDDGTITRTNDSSGNPPYTTTITIPALSVAITAVDMHAPWRDLSGAVHKVINISQTMAGSSYPANISIWLDKADGAGSGFVGWFLVNGPTDVISIGGQDDLINNLYIPTDPTQTPWIASSVPGPTQSPTPPPFASTSTFAVDVAQPCPANDITGAMFDSNPKSLSTIDYVLSNPGVYNWAYYQIEWTQPAFNTDYSYWISFVTVQKGKTVNGVGNLTNASGVTTFAATSGITFTADMVGALIHFAHVGYKVATVSTGSNSCTLTNQPGSATSTASSASGVAASLWLAAPDKEGVNDFPSLYWGRRISDSGALTGVVGGGSSASTVYLQGSWPPNWTDPWVANPNDPSGATTDYVEYRFWVWCVSILGMNTQNTSPGTITLQTAAWNGGLDDHGNLNPVQQPSALDLQQSNPYTLGDGMTGGGGVKPRIKTVTGGALTVGPSGVDVVAQGITASKMAIAAITAANQALAANSVVDNNVVSVGVPKLIAGSVVFTGDVTLSRGSTNPVITMNPTGLFLYGVAGTGGLVGLTSQPYVVIQNSNIGLFSGGNASVTLNSIAINLWSVNGNASFPFMQISSGNLIIQSNPFVLTVQAGGIVMQDHGSGNTLSLTPSNITLSAGTNSFVATASNLKLNASTSNLTITVSDITWNISLTQQPIKMHGDTSGSYVILKSIVSTDICTWNCDNVSTYLFGESNTGTSWQLITRPGFNPQLKMNGTQVMTVQQAGPGNPSFASFADVQTWCSTLLTGIRAHGLLT